ncbi:MAG TPA: MetQ/NlpA family ABC transporter substrate-binding protein [Clostridia bacterium]|nr:MetQ/NlpA family ABC transporter substrate-binding protein [Clostridia bacterium]
MKKIISIVLVILLLSVLVIGCSQSEGVSEEANVLRVGATPVPHGELLELIKEDLEEKGISLEVVEFTDYVKPNLALDDGEIDANFFQHLPYLEHFNEAHSLELVSVGSIHVEPLGLYSEKIDSIQSLANESTIAIPADSVNGGRALILLETVGLIELSEGAGLEATEEDIVKNEKSIRFRAIEAAQIPRVLQDVDAGIINGNYAIEAGINPIEDHLVLEGAESPYANIVTTRKDNKENESINLLLEALRSEKVKEYILNNYNGGVVPAF